MTGFPRSRTPKAGASARGQALGLLGAVRVATTDQCRALLTPNARSATYILRALNDLKAQKLADSWPIGRAQHWAWFLTRAGAGALNSRPELMPIPGRPVKPFSPGAAANGLLPHAIAGTQVLVDLLPAGADLADWAVEVKHQWLPGPSRHGHLITDAVLNRSEGTDGLPPVLLVEVDRNTERVPVLVRKLEAYLRYAQARLPEPYKRRSSEPAFQRMYPLLDRLPPLLVVLGGATPDKLARRAAQLVDELDYDAVWTHLDIGVVQAAELTARGPAAPIVTRVHAPEAPVPLARLPRTQREFAYVSSREYQIGHLGREAARLRESLAGLRSQHRPDGWNDWSAKLINEEERKLREALAKLRKAEASSAVPW